MKKVEMETVLRCADVLKATLSATPGGASRR